MRVARKGMNCQHRNCGLEGSGRRGVEGEERKTSHPAALKTVAPDGMGMFET